MTTKFLGRIRRGARLAWHIEYGGNTSAMSRSRAELEGMKLSLLETALVLKAVAWMEEQAKTKARWW